MNVTHSQTFQYLDSTSKEAGLEKRKLCTNKPMLWLIRILWFLTHRIDMMVYLILDVTNRLAGNVFKVLLNYTSYHILLSAWVFLKHVQ